MLKRFFTLFFVCFLSVSYASQELIIEPDAGREPLLSALHKARSSIDVVMYGMTDTRMIHALIAEKNKGKTVKILLEPHPYKYEKENDYAAKLLHASDVNLQWTSPDFQLTHQKTFIIDHHDAYIMTFNLTRASFKNERNFALKIDDPLMVKEIEKVFLADWKHQPVTTHHPDLIWSPEKSQEKIISFILGAKSSIKMYAQNVSDHQVIGALAKIAREGKRVEIILAKQPAHMKKKLDYLKRSGVMLHFNHRYYIHAKVIIVDDKKALLGSINMTYPSLRKNRELSVVTRDPNIVRQLVATFKKDG